jgi:hypothetical protein
MGIKSKILYALFSIFEVVFSVQCPATVDTSNQLLTEGFTYSLMTNQQVTEGFVCQNNLWSFLVVNGDISSNAHSLFIKMDANFDVVWEKAIQGVTYHNSVAYTNDENFLVFANYNTGACPLIKLSTNDGSIALQKEINSANSWKSVSLSPDSSYLFVAGTYSLGTHVFSISMADFSVSNAVSVPVVTLSSIYAYQLGGNLHNVIVNGVALLGLSYNVVAVNMNTSSKIWSKSLTCLITCSSGSDIRSLIWDALGVTLQLTTRGGTPLFYAMNLLDGSLYTSFYEANLGQTGMTLADISYSETDSKAYIIIKHDNGFSKIEFDPSTPTFSSSLVGSDRFTYFIREQSGFTYIGGNIIATGTNFISKLIGNGDNSLNQDVVLTTSGSTFVSTGGVTSSNDLLLIISGALNPGSTDTLFTFTYPGAYTTSVVNEYSSDVVYQGEFSEILYVQESLSGTVPFDFPWSISGGTAISSSIIPHPVILTMPSWISVSADGSSLNVTTPTFDSGTTYYFGTRSVILGENVDKSVTLILYQCSDPSWTSWNYSTPSIWNHETVGSEKDEVPVEIKQANTFIFASSTALPLISSILFLTNPTSMWGLINQYQLFLILPFSQWYLPGKFIDFIDELQISLLDFKFLSSLQIPIIEDLTEEMDYRHPYEEYRENRVPSGSFAVTQLLLFEVVLFIIATNLFFILILTLLNKCETAWVKFILKRGKALFNAAIYLRAFIESFMFWFLISVNEITRTQEAAGHQVSYFISWLYLTGAIIFVSFLLLFYKYTRNVSESSAMQEIFRELRSKHLAKLYYVIFIFRRIVTVIIIISTRNWEMYPKLTVYLIFQIISLWYPIIVRPFDGWQENLVDTFNDGIYVFGVAIVISFQRENFRMFGANKPSSKSQLGKIGINMQEDFLFYLLISNWIIIFILNLWFFIKNCMNSFMKNKKVSSSTTVAASFTNKAHIRPRVKRVISTKMWENTTSMENTSRTLKSMLELVYHI